MLCKIEGCGREANYKAAQLCQKHYFRIRRNGTTELKLERKRKETGSTRQYRVTMPGKGYQRLYEPNHPLSGSDGTVSEHRLVVFGRFGWNLPDCELCGKVLDWGTCHIDHIDRDVKNNVPENLRPLCRVCNTQRDYPERHTFKNALAITYEGATKTAHEWVKSLNLPMHSATLRRRLRQGMSVSDAFFAEKKTHNGKARHALSPK